MRNRRKMERKKLIEASRKRCTKLGVNPYKKRLTQMLTNNDLIARQNANRFLIDAALNYMNFVSETFKDCGSILALTDAECNVLKIVGPAEAMSSRRDLGLVDGISLREEDSGTNAVNLALRHRTPFHISGDEYFLKIFQQGCCFVAPIINGTEGLLGAIIIVHPQKIGHPHTFTLVKTLARLIVQEYKQIIQGDFIKNLCNSLNTAIVLTNPDGTVRYANLRARAALKIKETENFWHHFDAKLCAQENLNNEVVHSAITKQLYLMSCRKHNDDTIFILEPVEEELKKKQSIKQVSALYTFDDIMGLENIKSKTKRLALQDVNILITGESGTGKELMASAIHNGSRRAGSRFVAVNCGAIPDTLFESELFGYRKGAFTDARFDRPGKIEYADGGTLFLDEIGDLPVEVQGKLLRVLETKRVCPLGSNEEKTANVRFIFATNRNLKHMIRDGQLREDLYYRINTPMIQIPPLRERKHEIPDLISHFLCKFQDNHTGFTAGISDHAIKGLMEYDFPGNVRELEGILKSACLITQKEIIDIGDLDLGEMRGQYPFNVQVEKFKSKLVHECYAMHDRDVNKTSEALGISVRQVYRYLRKARPG